MSVTNVANRVMRFETKIVCLRCGSNRHVLANCPNKGPTQLDNRTPSSSSGNGRAGLSGGKSGPREAIITIETDPRTRLRSPEVEVVIEGVEGVQAAMVDTGATINAIRKDLVAHLTFDPSSVGCVALADNGRAKPLGEISTVLMWKGKSDGVTFVILENLHRPIYSRNGLDKGD